MSVERFIFGLGGAGRNVMIDASGRLICNAGGGDRLPFTYGDTGRACVVDPSGRLMINLDGTGGGGGGASTAIQLSMTDASGFYPTHNGEAALALCGRNDKGMRTDINQQRTDFSNSSGVFNSKIGSVSSAGGTSWIKSATGVFKGITAGTGVKLTAGTNDVVVDVKDFANASGAFVKTLASAGGTTLVATGTAPALSIKGLTAGSGMVLSAAASAITLNEKILIAKPFKILTSSTTLTIDLAQFNNYYLPLAHDTTITLNNPTDGQKIIIVIKQTSGSNTVAWPVAVKWPGGVAPVITAPVNSIDCVTLTYIATLAIYLADRGPNFA